MVEHIYTYINPPCDKDLAKACRVLENGGVLAYPTDVNWAFGCDSANNQALERIRKLKPIHPKEQPFSLICSSISMAAEFGNIDHSCYRLVKTLWPGPFTILLARSRNVGKRIEDKRRVVGIRIPNSPMVLALVERYRRPIATTSVPPIAEGSPVKMGYQVAESFGHAIDLILDLGEELPSMESTIIDFTSGSPILVRHGAGDPKLIDLDL